MTMRIILVPCARRYLAQPDSHRTGARGAAAEMLSPYFNSFRRLTADDGSGLTFILAWTVTKNTKT